MQVAIHGAELLFPRNPSDNFVFVKRVDHNLAEVGEWHRGSNPFGRYRIARFEWCVCAHGTSVRATHCLNREWAPQRVVLVFVQV